MKVRFLADADPTKAIVSGVLRREPSIDFLMAKREGVKAVAGYAKAPRDAERRNVDRIGADDRKYRG